MLYLLIVMRLVLRMWKETANILRNPAHDDSMVDAWVMQQTRLRQAIAQAKSKDAPTKPADPHDECVGPWVRQKMRLRQAIAQAKREHLAAKSRDAQ